MNKLLILGILSLFTSIVKPLEHNQKDELVSQCSITIDTNKFDGDTDPTTFHDDLAFAFYYQLSSSNIRVPQLHLAKMLSMYLPELSLLCEKFEVERLSLHGDDPYTLILKFNHKVQSIQLENDLTHIPYISTIEYPEVDYRPYGIALLLSGTAIGGYFFTKKILLPFIKTKFFSTITSS
ncbi:hypothetical protein HOM50_00610 [bacterium]|jgi:hypothetical protein|nr:hypothetical protein [bacterium]MBT5014892.1 hypothetical protein [bacterium]